MAITIQNTFNDLVALQSPLVVTASSTNTGQAKFRFCLTVTINGAEVITVRQTKNANNYAHFDLYQIIKDYFEAKQLESTTPIHKILTCVGGDDTGLYVQLNVFEEYASSSTTDPTEYPSTGNATASFIAIMAEYQFTSGVTPTLAGLIEYDDDNTEISWLSNMPLVQDVRVGEYRTAAICISDFRGSTYPVDTAIRVNFTFYEADGTQISTANVTRLTIGMDEFITSKSTANAAKIYQFLPIGYQNLEDQSFNANVKPSANANLAYYTVQIFDNTNLGNGYQTKTYRFNVVDDCRYTPIQLAWLNEYGVWDYFTFELAHTKRLNVERNTITKDYGNWNAGAVYSFNQYEAGEEVVNIKGGIEYTVNSNWLTEEQFNWLQSLLMSKKVYFVNSNADFQAVVVNSNDYIFKQDVDEQLANLEIKFTLAQKLR